MIHSEPAICCLGQSQTKWCHPTVSPVRGCDGCELPSFEVAPPDRRLGGAEKGDLLQIFYALQERHGNYASADVPPGERGFEHSMQSGTPWSAFTIDTVAMRCFVSQREMESALPLGGVERRHDRDGLWLHAPGEARIEVNAAPQPL